MDVACSHLASTAREIDTKYTAVTTAWTDSSRGVTCSGLSCLGGNITDQRLVSKDGHVIPYVRTDNFDELLGVVDPGNVIVTTGGGHLAHFLEHIAEHAAHEGYTLDPSTSVEPGKVAMRFQNSFVGIKEGETRQVAPSNFSYQTSEADDPRNLTIVFTPSDYYVHVDGVGHTPLLAHERVENTDNRRLSEKWFTVTASDLAVGQSTMGGPFKRHHGEHGDNPIVKGETATPCEDNVNVELGLRGSGARLNRMLVVSVPLEQKPRQTHWEHCYEEPVLYRSCNSEEDGESNVGTARAAVLGVGETIGEKDIADMQLKIDPAGTIVVTQIDYNTLSLAADAKVVTVGKEAVELAIRDMNRQYEMCEDACRLSELPAMLHKLTRADHTKIQKTLEAVVKKETEEVKEQVAANPFKPHKNALRAFQ